VVILKILKLASILIIAGLSVIPGSVSNAEDVSPTIDNNIDIVILVDESGSLSEADVNAEREAVKGIIGLQTLKNRNIKVGVLPFSSGLTSPRLNDDCVLRPIDDGGDFILADCAKSIKRKLGKEDSNTDFAAAFSSVSNLFKENDKKNPDEVRTHSIILLTDGFYDPDGDKKISADETISLNNSFSELRDANVAVWSLGFGSAELETLTSYSNDAGIRDTRCDAPPNGRLVDVKNLSLQLMQIVAEATCGVVSDAMPTPSQRFIHPLINTVSVTVVTSDGKEPVLTAQDGNKLCSGDWKQQGDAANSKIFGCVVQEDGSHAGNWKVEASKGSTVVWEYLGTVIAEFDTCPFPSSLSFSRFDGKTIDFSKATLWPTGALILESIPTNNQELGQSTPIKKLNVRLNQKQVQFGDKFDTNVEKSQVRVENSGNSDNDGLPRLNLISRPCLSTSPPPPSTTTTISPTTTATSTTTSTIPPPPCTIDCPCTKGFWGCHPGLRLMLILLLVGSACGYAFLYWSRSKKFPQGTIVKQESPVKPGLFIEVNNSDIGGMKRVSLTRGGSSLISVEPYGKHAEYVLSSDGDEVRIEYNPDPESDDKTQIQGESYPYGIRINLKGFATILVEKPVSEDDQSDN
jgi:hypothetical protein